MEGAVHAVHDQQIQGVVAKVCAGAAQQIRHVMATVLLGSKLHMPTPVNLLTCSFYLFANMCIFYIELFRRKIYLQHLLGTLRTGSFKNLSWRFLRVPLNPWGPWTNLEGELLKDCVANAFR